MLKFVILLPLLLFSATVTPTFAQEKIVKFEKAAPWPSSLSTLESIPSSDVIEKVVLLL